MPLPAHGVSLPPAALALLSGAVLLLLLDHRRRNLGGRSTLAFLVSASLYGLVRGTTIRRLVEVRLGGNLPYRLTAPVATLAGVPLQELVGWVVAVGIAAWLADRLLRRLGQPTDAFRTTLAAGVGLATVCLAVESAAVAGGWWTWSLQVPPGSPLSFPSIALVDWAFVAVDFLLPFELWHRQARLSLRLASLGLFPLHMAGHALTGALPGPLPFSGFDWVHAGLVALLFAGAAMARRPSSWPALSQEAGRSRIAVAVAVLLATTSAQGLVAGTVSGLWTGLPLAALAAFALSGRREREAPSTAPSPIAAVAVFLLCLSAGLALRYPSASRARAFETRIRQAVAQIAAGNPQAAEASLGEALALRPGHSEALALLGWAELRQGRTESGCRHLEAALAARPDSAIAARLLGTCHRPSSDDAGASAP